MQTHQLKPRIPKRHRKQVGRGGKRGKTAGRGTKGQKARAGHRIRPEIRDLIKKLPKKRGYRFASFQIRPILVRLGELERAFESGAVITPAALREKGLLRGANRRPAVKVLATGEVKKALQLSGIIVSAAARAKIEAAGGRIN